MLVKLRCGDDTHVVAVTVAALNPTERISRAGTAPATRGQTPYWQARAHREVAVARQQREVACLDGILRQGAVAMPVARPNTRCNRTPVYITDPKKNCLAGFAAIE